MWKAFALAALVVLGTLPGCATVAPTAAAPQPPRRHLLDVEEDAGGPPTSQAALWGINFIKDVMETYTWQQIEYIGYYREPRWYTYTGQRHVLQYTTVGNGTFEYRGNGRVLYRVPDDQMLVINEISGGNVAVNGLWVGTGLAVSSVPLRKIQNPWGGAPWDETGAETPGRITVNYIFGPGDDVVFTANPATTIAGYTVNPELVGGQLPQGGRRAAK